MRVILFFSLVIFLTSCPKSSGPIFKDPDCGGCGLKEEGKKYKNLKKGKKVKDKKKLPTGN